MISCLKTESRSGPDDVGVVEPVGPTAVRPRLTVQVDPGHRERRDDHGEAAQQEDRTSDREKPSMKDNLLTFKAIPVDVVQCRLRSKVKTRLAGEELW